MDIEKTLSQVKFDEHNEANIEMLHDFIKELVKLPNKRDAIPILFVFIEKHHDKDLGSPGPLVHFIEEESDYHQALRNSLKRKPTALTLWMVNRILNGLNSDEKKEWFSVLEWVISNESTDEDTKTEAIGYLEYQFGKR